jgi:hypothetical protein
VGTGAELEDGAGVPFPFAAAQAAATTPRRQVPAGGSGTVPAAEKGEMMRTAVTPRVERTHLLHDRGGGLESGVTAKLPKPGWGVLASGAAR